MLKRNRLVGFFIIPIIFSTLSCATTFLKPDNSKEALEKMVHIVWDAKKAGDWGKVYDAADLKFKKRKSKKEFHGNLRISDYKILKLEIEENGKKAFSVVSFKVSNMGMVFNIKIKEAWLFEDGKWRLKLSDPVNPFAMRKNKN